jgi:hypothetical protein
MTHGNLLPEPPETLLPADPAAQQLAAGVDPEQVVRAHPQSCLAWATLARTALSNGRDLEGYAYARVGYHRGLDLLRRSGWKGRGPVPWSHEPNRGFLTALALLATAAGRIGEGEEEERCTTFLRDSSAEAAEALGA